MGLFKLVPSCDYSVLVRLAFAALAVVLLGSPAAFAQQPGGDAGSTVRDEARSLAKEGLAKLDAGDAKSAIVLFEQAEAKFHAPTHLLYLAQAHVSLGEKVLAARLYQRLVSEVLPNYAPDAFREAQSIGKTELAPLAAQLGRIRLAGAGKDVTVDGEVVEGAEWYVAPGAHDVRFAGGARRVELLPGAEAVVDVSPPAPQDGPQPPAASSGLRPLTIGRIVSMSVGGAAAIAGGVLGALSLMKVDEIADRCPTKRGCDPADEALADEARTLGNASTGLLVAGGAAFVTGLVLVLIPGDEPPPSTRTTGVYPLVGPGFAGVDVVF